jgi:biopolymer transport protein ExbB/TolQ
MFSSLFSSQWLETFSPQQFSSVFYLLLCSSIGVLALGAERLFYMQQAKKRLRISKQSILEHLAVGQATMAQAVNSTLPAHPAQPLLELLLKSTDAQHFKAIPRLQNLILYQLRQRIWLLGSMAAIAPFIGLFGTVLGVMDAFKGMAEAQATGFHSVSAGLSEALITTAAGIFVGVEAIILFNWVQVTANAYAFELRHTIEEIAENTSFPQLKN